jgi:hypothetical protein
MLGELLLMGHPALENHHLRENCNILALLHEEEFFMHH